MEAMAKPQASLENQGEKPIFFKRIEMGGGVHWEGLLKNTGEHWEFQVQWFSLAELLKGLSYCQAKVGK